MENSIKEYIQLTYIETFDGEIIPLVEEMGVVWELLDNNSKFLNVWNEMISKSIIKRVFIKQVDEVDNAILKISDKNLRMRVQAEIDKRRKEWSRVNMEVYRNVLNRLSE